LDNEQTGWLIPDSTQPFSDRLFCCAQASGVRLGLVVVTVHASGIPGLAMLVDLEPAVIYLPLVAK